MDVFSGRVCLEQMVSWGLVQGCICSLNFPYLDRSVFTGWQNNIVTEMDDICNMSLMSLNDCDYSARKYIVNHDVMEGRFWVFSCKINEVLFLAVKRVIEFRFWEFPGLKICKVRSFLVKLNNRDGVAHSEN